METVVTQGVGMGRVGKWLAWLIVLGVCLFGDLLGLDRVFGNLRGQDEQEGSPYGLEAKVLQHAVRKWQDCRIGSVEVKKYDTKHNLVGTKFEDPDGKTGGRLAGLKLPLVFKWGRYDLLFLRQHAVLEDGTEAVVMSFTPRSDPIEAGPGEDANLNKALNKLTGTVYLNLDPAGTGGGNIVRVYGNLEAEVPYSKWYTLSKPVFWLQELGFNVKQTRHGEKWLPDSVSGGYTWRRLRGEPNPNEFTLKFDCGS